MFGQLSMGLCSTLEDTKFEYIFWLVVFSQLLTVVQSTTVRLAFVLLSLMGYVGSLSPAATVPIITDTPMYSGGGTTVYEFKLSTDPEL
jgi:hypothetical protein